MILHWFFAGTLFVLASCTAAFAQATLPILLVDELPVGRIAFVTGRQFGAAGTIAVLGQKITPFEGNEPEFSPNDDAIFYSKFSHTLKAGEVKSAIFMQDLTNNTTTSIDVDNHDADAPSISRADGDLVFVGWTADRKASHIYHDNGNSFIQLTNGNHHDWSPHWSHDARQIVFESTRDGERQIYVMDADGKNQTNLSNDKIMSHAPSWSPKGDQIAYMSVGSSGHSCIFAMNKDGTEKRNLSNGPSRDSEPTWSPDGQWIAFTRTEKFPSGKESMDIWIMKNDGTEQKQITQNKEGVSSYRSTWGALAN